MSESMQTENRQPEVHPIPAPHPPAQTPPERIEPVWKVPASAPAQEAPPKETFSKGYVSELRAESEAWRKKHQKALADLNKLKQDTQQQFTQNQQAAHERIIRAELKALALKAGLRDLDCLKLADLSAVTLKDDDTLEGAAEMLAQLKEAKPYLFLAPERSTSPLDPPPARKEAKPTDVSQLPLEDYERSKNAYLRAALRAPV